MDWTILTGTDDADSAIKDGSVARKSNSAGEDIIRQYMNNKVSRRAAMSTGAKVGIGVVVVAIAGVGIYEAYAASTSTSSTTTTTTTSSSPVSTTSSSAPPSSSTTTSTGPTTSVSGNKGLTFVHWSFENAQITDYVHTFDSETGFSTTEDVLDNDNYNPLIESLFGSGTKVDMNYANGYEVPRLINLGYCQDFSSFPNISTIASEMYPTIVSSLSTAAGVQYGLCYYWSFRPILTVDDDNLNKTSLAGQRPVSWGDLWTNSGPAVAKAGVVQYPCMPNWFAANYGIGWDFMGEMQNVNNDPEGTATLFNSSFEPVFDTTGPAADLLTEWASATKGGVVDPSVFSQSSESCTVASGSTNNYAYVTTAFYDWQSLNESSTSNIPVGDSNWAPPSSQQAGWGQIETGVYCWPVNNNNATGATDIISWFGYEDPTTGQRVTQPEWAIEAALGSGYPDTLEDPSVITGYQAWLGSRTTTVLANVQTNTGAIGTPFAWKSLSFVPWLDTIYPVLGSVASGVLGVTQGLTTMLNVANSQYNTYYGTSSS